MMTLDNNIKAILLTVSGSFFAVLMESLIRSAQYDSNVYTIGFLRFFFGLIIILPYLIKKKSVLLVEKNPQFGEGISSRNSEVIHAGIYYPENSLKAKFCRDGMERLYRYCYEKKISIKQTGKLIVQTCAKDEDKLLKIYNLGKKNGCNELRLLNSQEINVMYF